MIAWSPSLDDDAIDWSPNIGELDAGGSNAIVEVVATGGGSATVSSGATSTVDVVAVGGGSADVDQGSVVLGELAEEYRLTAVPDLEPGDIVFWYGVVGGDTSDVEVYDDGTFHAEAGVESFIARVLRDGVFGEPGVQSLQIALTAGRAEASGRVVSFVSEPSITIVAGRSDASSRTLALSVGQSHTLDRGSAAAQGRALSVPGAVSVELERGKAAGQGQILASSTGFSGGLIRGSAEASGLSVEPQHGHSLTLSVGEAEAAGRQVNPVVGDSADLVVQRGGATSEGRFVSPLAGCRPLALPGLSHSSGRTVATQRGQILVLSRGRSTSRGVSLSVFTGLVLATPVVRTRSRSLTPKYSSRSLSKRI